MDDAKLMAKIIKKKDSIFKIKEVKQNYKKLIIIIILFILNIYELNMISKLKKNIDQIFYFLSSSNMNIRNNKILQSVTNNLNENTKNNNNFLEEYIKTQNDFCDNPGKYYKQAYEKLITLTNFSFQGLSYQLYVYKQNDNYMSNGIIRKGIYEPGPMSNFLKALEYYGRKKKIVNNKDIFMIDIGGNIRAHTSFIGKHGYSVITFEASPRNYYILNKNYCNINRNSNIILINKAISNEDKICNYYSQMDGIGNGILLCDENSNKITTSGFQFNKTFEVSLTKLSNFFPYLSNKNLALIKLDIEGGEVKAIEDGIEFINKMHVPFIFSEFTPSLIKRQKSDPKKYLKYFVDNGYTISTEGFFGKYLKSIEDIKGGNLYFTYNGN